MVLAPVIRFYQVRRTSPTHVNTVSAFSSNSGRSSSKDPISPYTFDRFHAHDATRTWREADRQVGPHAFGLLPRGIPDGHRVPGSRSPVQRLEQATDNRMAYRR